MEVYIKNVMQQQGVTTGELARRLGKSLQNTSNIVNGGKNLSMNTLQQVADALGVPAWRLVAPGGVGELPAQDATGTAASVSVCPYCGHELTVRVE